MNLIKAPCASKYPPAQQKIDIFTSAATIFKQYFGRFWTIFPLVLLAVAFWPILAFRKLIVFNPAAFVTEWVKISVEVVLLFLIIEIVNHRNTTRNENQSLHSLMMANYIAPGKRMIELLNIFRKELESDDSAEATRAVLAVCDDWSIIENALAYDHLSTFHGEREIAVQLLQKRNKLDPTRCKSILNSLTTDLSPESFNEGEFKELLERLEAFRDDVKSLLATPSILGGRS